VDTVTPDEFLEYTRGNVPVVLKRNSVGWEASPVTAKWFDFKGQDDQQRASASKYLSGFGHTLVTYEWTLIPSVKRFIFSLEPEDLRKSLLQHVADNAASKPPSPFLRFQAPLDLFLAALDYNTSQHAQIDKLTGLYIAQSSLSGLPKSLQQDLTPPRLMDDGSIYNSSIWLGLTPTYTPLHRDPNPNLFRQLHGSKIIRLLPPRAGETVFKKVQTSISGSANPRLRGQEMMHGPEKTALHDAIWTDDGDPRVGERTIYEARLDAGDAMYLPTGWWHSIKSAAADAESGLATGGELNCSVNWWFRSSSRK
jgi:hypothetical protein